MAGSPLRISARVDIDASGAKTGAAEANTAVSSIGTTADQAAAKLDNLQKAASQGIRSPLSVVGGKEAAGSADAAAAALDRLRAKYNPLFAVISNYKITLAEIREAHALGALSADEMTAAIQRHRQAALADIDAIKGRNTVMAATAKVSTGNYGYTSNIAAQFQDIGVTAAMGMSPLQIALQQGTQLSAVFNDLKHTGQGVGSALAAAFTSIISPVSLVTIGLVAASAAAIQYFSKVGSSTVDADEAIKRHADIIKAVKAAYGEAANGLSDYVAQSQSELAATARTSLKDLQAVATDARTEFLDSFLPNGSLWGRLGVERQFLPFKSALEDFRDSARTGRPDFMALRSEVERLVATDPKGLRAAGDALLSASSSAANAERRVRSAENAIAVIGGTAEAQLGSLADLNKALRELAGIAVPALNESERAASVYRQAIAAAQGAEDRASARSAYEAALQRIGNQNPTVINSDGNQTSVPLPGTKPITLGDAPSKAEKSAATAAQRAADAYRDLKKSAQDRIEQMQLEAQVSGLTGIAADTLRFKQELLQATGDKGRKATPEQRAEIEKLGKAYEEAATKAAKLQLQSNLQFDREQLGRSTFDQQIANGLRSAGLAIDFDSYEAGLIRTNLQLQYARELVGDINSTFWSGIEQGKGLWESFGDAGVSALKKIADTLMNDVLNSIFSVQSAGSSSGGLFSSLLGGLGSLFGGSSSTSAASWASSGSFDTSSGFSLGGWTGPGSMHQPAGVVHADEFVFSKAATRAIGVDNLYAMHDAALSGRGLAEGGVLNVSPLFSSQQRAANASGSIGGLIHLAIKISQSIDEGGNITSFVKNVVAQDAPGIAAQVVDDFSSNVLPDRQAEIAENPRWR